MKRRWLLLLALVLVVGGAIAGWTGRGVVIGKPLPPIPDGTVPVTEVRTIEVPGPERVIERVRWRTREAPVSQSVVAGLLEDLCPQLPDAVTTPPATGSKPTDAAPTLTARVEVTADQYLGVDPAGATVRGWQGEAVCEVQAGTGPWRELAREPFDLASSEAVAEAATNPVERPRSLWEAALGLTSDPGVRAEVRRYAPGRRLGFYLAGRYDLDPAETYQPSYDTYSVSGAWAVEGGLAWRSRR